MDGSYQYYFAVVLDPSSATDLAGFVAARMPLHTCLICHHMTILYGTSDVEALRQAAPYFAGRIGQSVTLLVLGIAADERVQAVHVGMWDDGDCITQEISDNAYPHITVARTIDARSVESNTALSRCILPAGSLLRITGTLTCVEEPI